MTITVVFDSLEEFQKHMTTGRECMTITQNGVTIAQEGVVPSSAEPQETAEAPEVSRAEEKPKKPADTGTGAIRGATPEEMEQYKAEEKAAKPAPKAPRVEDIRKALAALNKKAGKNIAKELIASVGYKKLTEVPEGALVTLQSLIEEEEKNYAG